MHGNMGADREVSVCYGGISGHMGAYRGICGEGLLPVLEFVCTFLHFT